MQPSQQLRTALRVLVDETVPDGGADEDTLFANAEIDQLLTDAENMNEAAAAAWTLKAGRVVSTEDVTETAVGAERYRFVDPATRATLAQSMADMYARRAPDGGSRILSVIEPDVLGACEPVVCCDVSRLICYDASGRWYRGG